MVSAASRQTTTAAAACWRGGSSRTASASFASSQAAGAGNQQWDAHSNIEENHLRKAAQTDRPVAALLTDLKRRGLLDTTLVVWGGEFGRSPEAESGKGRDHHNLGFTMWMAGGGVKGGTVVGATDAIGLHADRTSLPFPRHSYDDPSSTGARPAQAHIPTPRAERAADLRGGEGGRRDRLRIREGNEAGPRVFGLENLRVPSSGDRPDRVELRVVKCPPKPYPRKHVPCMLARKRLMKSAWGSVSAIQLLLARSAGCATMGFDWIVRMGFVCWIKVLIAIPAGLVYLWIRESHIVSV